jgi:hypothetical protein
VKKLLWFLMLCAVAVRVMGGEDSKQADGKKAAPTYYIATNIRECAEDQIKVVGVTNLPPTSVLGIEIIELKGDGFGDSYSERVFVPVGKSYRFDAVVRPKPGKRFRSGLIVSSFFSPGYHSQSSAVLAEVGFKGENLDLYHNPQAGSMSGGFTYIAAISGVHGCPSTRD